MFKFKKEYPTTPEILQENTKNLYNLGFSYKDKKKYELSIACALEVYNRNDNELNPYQFALNLQNMGYVLLLIDESEAAQFALNIAIDSYIKQLETNNSFDLVFRLSACYSLARDLKNAMKTLEISLVSYQQNAIRAYYEEDFDHYKENEEWKEFLFGTDKRIDRIRKNQDYFKENQTYYYQEAVFNETLNYIVGSSSKVVVLSQQADYYAIYNLQTFTNFLAPLEFWTDLDLRIANLTICNYMNKGYSYSYGMHETFINWLNNYRAWAHNTSVFDDVLDKMMTLGLTNEDIIYGFNKKYTEIHNSYYQISTWGKRLIKIYLDPNTKPSIHSVIRSCYTQEQMDCLLYMYDPELFDKKGPENFLKVFSAGELNQSYNKRNPKYTACNVLTFKMLTYLAYDKYKTLLDSTYTQITDIQTLNELIYWFSTKNPDLTVKHVQSIMDLLNEENEYSNYYSNPFSVFHTIIHHTRSYDKDTKKYNYPENIKKWTLEWFPKLRYLRYNDFEEILDFFGQDAVPTIMDFYKNNEFVDKAIWNYLESYSIADYSDILQSKLKSKAKYTNDICKALAKMGDSQIDFALELCNGKTVDQRKSGIYILSLINSETATQHIEGFLEKETNDDIRDMIFETIVNSNPSRNENLTFDEIITRIQKAEKNGRLKKNVKPWLEESSLPKLYWKNGSELKETEVRYILYRQNRSSLMLPELELKPLLEFIDLTKSQDFAIAIWKLYFENSAQAKDKFVLAICGLLGGDAMIDPIMKQIKTWCDEGRGKMAENLALAMGAIGSNKALRAIDTLSRKYKNKQKNVGEAAVKAFENAAIVMNITPFELADKIIPDFDFLSTFEMLEIKNKNYRAFVDSSFEMIFMDDNGKKIKKLPAGADKETVERFKVISKELKESLKFLTTRLEFYMVVQRRWEIEDWQGLFLKNPVVFPFTLSLVWGIFENNVLKSTFTSLDDCSLVDVNYEPIEFAANQQIGLLHPFEMQSQEGLIESWQNYMSENNITQPFSQLIRPINLLDESKKEMKMETEYEKIKLSSSKFVRMLENAGWQKGPTEDGGSICSYSKSFTTQNLKAWIIFEGWIYVGYYDEGSSDLAVGKIGFVPLKMENQRYYYYPYNEKDENLIAFGEIPSIVYSEVMADVKMFTEKAKIGE